MDLNIHSQFSVFDHLYPKENRRVLDPIFSFMDFDDFTWKIIDTPEYQRMRNLKQLGMSYLVFPGGCHTRFEHCLGTGFLAQKQMRILYKRQPHLKDEDSDRLTRNVHLAGLCHDLGHGPFSHVFDGLVIKAISPDSKWRHEDASAMMFESLCDNNYIDLEREDIRMVQDLILAKNHDNYERKWIFDIVSNKRNSVDVDKFDYLIRDGYHLGVKDTYFDYKTLMKECRVIDNEICYPSKHAYKLYDLFQTRYKMYKGVYLNRVTQGLDLMLSDILLHANSVYSLQEKIYNPSDYLHLTDYIIEEIDRSNNLSLTTSKNLIKKLKTRNIYKFVAEVLLENEYQVPKDLERMKVDIVSGQENEGGRESELKLEDFRLSVGNINFGLQNHNPLDHIRFFNKGDLSSSFKMNNKDISFCLPNKYSENFIRIFVTDGALIKKANKAFNNYLKKFLNINPGKAVFYRLKSEEGETTKFDSPNDRKRKLFTPTKTGFSPDFPKKKLKN